MPLDKITSFCFGASYAVALLLELLQLIRPRPVQRLVGLLFGGAGLLAQTLYLVVQQPSLASPAGSLLFLSWILAVFYLYGSLHHRQLAWGVFVLPMVLGLVVLTALIPSDDVTPGPFDAWRGGSFWGVIDGSLLLLAAVGGCVGFVASIMYLVQARRLRLKAAPGDGVKMLSLERIEQMNRRAINLAFPLLTAGVLVGLALLFQRADQLN